MITWQLSQLCFDWARSLFEEDGELQVKTCISRGLLLHEPHSLADINRGPFISEKDCYQPHVSPFLVKYSPLGHHCLFAPIPAQSEYNEDTGFRNASDGWRDFVTVQSKIDGSDDRTDYVIVGKALSEMIEYWTNNGSKLPLDDPKRRLSIQPP